jgi:4-amino-4-deoxy-L-arabinose transferase-like glycosyltransferase
MSSSPTGSSSAPLPSGPRAVLLASLVALLLLLAFPAALRNPDEPRDCEIGREWAAGTWSRIPRFNGEPYWSKPPLFHVSVGAAMSATGSRDEVVPKVVAGLWGVAAVAATAALGEALLGPGLGLLAGLMLLATHYFFQRYRIATTDTAYAALSTLSMLGFFLARRSERARDWALMGAAAGLAALAKGAHGLLLPFLAGGAVLAAGGEARRILAPRFLGALLLGAALFSTWLTLLRFDVAAGGGPGLVHAFLFENLERRFGDAAHHDAPWYHYGSLAGRALPWTIVALAGAWGALARRGEVRERLLGPLLWAAATTLALSLASGKRSVYLLPVLPAVALLAAGTVDTAARGLLPPWPERIVRWTVELGSMPVRWTPFARRGLVARAVAAALIVAAGNFAYALAVVGPASRAESLAPVARRAAEIAGSRTLVLFRATREDVAEFAFALDRTIPVAGNVEELRRLAAAAPVAILVRRGVPEKSIARGFLTRPTFDRWAHLGPARAPGEAFDLYAWDGK